MRKLVYALIRRRIRTLFPEPLIITMARNRVVQAVAVTVIMYISLFLFLYSIEIEPTRSVDLYRQAIAVTIDSPSAFEQVEDLPSVSVSENAEETILDSGDGVYSSNTDPGLELIDSGEADGPSEEDPTADDNNAKPPGPDDTTAEGAADKVPKHVLRKLRITPGAKPETSTKPKPPPERFVERDLIAEVSEPVREIVEEVVDEPEPTPVEDPAEDPVETPVPDLVTEESTTDEPVEEVVPARRSNIMPAYIVDRYPQIAEIVPVEFPEEFKEKEVELSVLLNLYLDSTGKIVNLLIIETGGIEFTEAAISALLDPSTVIEPAYVGDLAVPSLALIRFDFKSFYEEESP